MALFVDIVSNNGNLLLNIWPKPDGSISEIQLDRLHKLGDWLAVNGEGIFSSRPWIRAKAASGETDVRFTQNNDALYVFYLKGGSGKTLLVPGVSAGPQTKAAIGQFCGTRCLLQPGRLGPNSVRRTDPAKFGAHRKDYACSNCLICLTENGSRRIPCKRQQLEPMG